MDRISLEKYYNSTTIFLNLFKKGLITKDDYLKAEGHLAEKYCIKKDNLYRRIDLI